MSDRKPSPRRRPIAVELVRADDQLLDALGQGAPAPGDDRAAVLLAAWRADLAPTEPAPAPIAGPAPVPGPGAAREPGDASDADAPAVEPVVPSGRSRRSRRLLGVAAVFAVLAVGAVGTSVAAASGTPGSPLWPVTRMLYPDRADTLDAQAAIDDARRALAAGDRDEARRQVDRATGLVSRVRDPDAAARLRTQLDELRQALAAAAGTGSVPIPAPSVGPTGGGAPGPGGTTGGGTPGTGATTGGGGVLPTGLPSLPVPSILPSVPVLGK
jgi:hypothetical protein